jgi:hypothetical protein
MGTYSEARTYDDLQIGVTYFPPREEGNSLIVAAGPIGRVTVNTLLQFDGDGIPAHRLAGDGGMTGLYTVHHPTSGATLEYSCVKDGAAEPAIAASRTPARITCATFYRRDVTRAPGGARRLVAEQAAPRHTSDYPSLGMSVEYREGDPREVHLVGTDRASGRTAFEVRYAFREPPADWYFSQGFSGLGYFNHESGAELQFFCSSGSLEIE